MNSWYQMLKYYSYQHLCQGNTILTLDASESQESLEEAFLIKITQRIFRQKETENWKSGAKGLADY